MSDRYQEEQKNVIDKAMQLIDDLKSQNDNLLESNKRLLSIAKDSLDINGQATKLLLRAHYHLDVVEAHSEYYPVGLLPDMRLTLKEINELLTKGTKSDVE